MARSMNEEHLSHPKAIALQRVVATVCIVVLCIVYLAGYVQWHKLVGVPHRTVASAQMARLEPASPAPLIFAPDVPPPQVQNGLAPIISHISTKQPVVFLTIDDGVYREPDAAAKMKAARVPASLFLTQRYITAEPGYFSYITQQTGSVIENHTMNHRDLAALGYEDQRKEICTTSDIYTKVYGKRPTLFRPPYGSYNTDTQKVVAACGMKALVLWRAVVQDGAIQYQFPGGLRAGDIVLMHFTPAFKQDLQAFISAAKAAGLHPQLLEDWTGR
jgi:peptidoglycan/xylan/chitin deacetylase (PgdA/CDA1 family)